jgi:hypothetical protein
MPLHKAAPRLGPVLASDGGCHILPLPGVIGVPPHTLSRGQRMLQATEAVLRDEQDRGGATRPAPHPRLTSAPAQPGA